MKHNIPFGEDFTKICDAIYKDKQEISVSFDDDKTSTVINFASFNQLLFSKISIDELIMLLGQYPDQFKEEYRDAFLLNVSNSIVGSISDLQKIIKSCL